MKFVLFAFMLICIGALFKCAQANSLCEGLDWKKCEWYPKECKWREGRCARKKEARCVPISDASLTEHCKPLNWYQCDTHKNKYKCRYERGLECADWIPQGCFPKD